MSSVGHVQSQVKELAISGDTSDSSSKAAMAESSTRSNNASKSSGEGADKMVEATPQPSDTMAVEGSSSRSGHAANPLSGEGSTRNPEEGAFTARAIKTAPLYKLSVNLIKTYMYINEVYYKKKEERQRKRQRENNQTQGARTQYNNGYDDKDYNYLVNQGEVLNQRYRLDRIMGKGSFGQVIKAFDVEEQKEVAVKIIKSKKPFYEQAKTEISLLKYLNENDIGHQYNIVRLLDHFEYQNHKCLVFEMLSLTLYDLLRNTNFKGVSLNLIRKFAKQILHTLKYLSYKEVIHCDLKPENILLRDKRHSAIKVIDFGSSCHSRHTVYQYIQSRFYRSPEVLLGSRKYGVQIDMWSLGCILVEMHTGEPLFSGQNEAEQVVKMWELLGLPSKDMILGGTKADHFYEMVQSQSGGIKYRLKSLHNYAPRERTIESVLGIDPQKDPYMRHRNGPGHSATDYLRFKDLVLKMLDYNPETRITPDTALLHPFFKSSTDQEVQTEGGVAISPRASVSSGTNTVEYSPREIMEEGESSTDPKTRNMCLQVHM